jgi:1-acyl-sn-glycerol-3-phosphate acyltransferase
MAAGDPREPDPTGATVELAVGGLRPDGQRAPAPREQLRQHLPGLEPERRVSDWGRSERLEGLVDRTLYEFLYHYWFRVDVEGIENVPLVGGALLVANRSGALPADSVMVARAIKEEHRHARPVHLATTNHLGGVPGLGALVTKLGGVPDHPANVHRLLFDECQLVLVFPEGSAGARKSLRERYRLRDFGDGDFVRAALRARVPIVPVAVIGGEEAMPTLGRIGLLGPFSSRARLPVFSALPLPAKFKIRFLEPVAPDSLGTDSGQDEALIQALSADIRGLIQENLLEMVGRRRSAWLA